MKGVSLVFLGKSEMQPSGSSLLIQLLRSPSNLGITEGHVPVEVFSKKHRIS